MNGLKGACVRKLPEQSFPDEKTAQTKVRTRRNGPCKTRLRRKRLKKSLPRRKRLHAFGEEGGSRAFFPLSEKCAAQINGGGASRILIPDGIREVEGANTVRQGTGARRKYKSNHGYILFGTTAHPPVIIAVLPVFVEYISFTHRHTHFEYWAHHAHRFRHAHLHPIALHRTGQDLLFNSCFIGIVVGVQACYRIFQTSLNMGYHLGSLFEYKTSVATDFSSNERIGTLTTYNLVYSQSLTRRWKINSILAEKCEIRQNTFVVSSRRRSLY